VTSSTAQKAVFSALLVMPALAFPAVGFYLFFFTNLPQLLYLSAIRNIYFDCMRFVSEAYVYSMKPGPCPFTNLEFDVVLTHDGHGFRNARRSVEDYDVAVLGDSHAHGWGVQDDETFASILEGTYRRRTINLAMASYATAREFEALQRHGGRARYVVLQYCDNDAGENDAALRLDPAAFRRTVEQEWTGIIGEYHVGKARKSLTVIRQLATLLRERAFESKARWRRQVLSRDVTDEAATFARLVARYRNVLEGKRLILFEASGWNGNSPTLPAALVSALRRIEWLRYTIIDTATLLDAGDYFFLDDHLNRRGHRKLADAIAAEISKWESLSPERIVNMNALRQRTPLPLGPVHVT
jgi:lysophospholipase L1-like esterase